MAKKSVPTDRNQLAKYIVDLSTRETPEPVKNPAAVALGRLGGLKGGKARAESLTGVQRRQIAENAAIARWKKAKQ
jgi:hypothetical protein